MFKKLIPDIVRQPEFQKLWWAQIFAAIAFNTLTYSLIIRVAERTSSNTAVALFILSFSVPSLIFGLLAGVWVDRLDRRKVLFLTNFSRTLLIPLFYFAEQSNFLLIYPLAIGMSIITQFFIPAESTKLSAIVPRKLLHQANSLFTFSLYVTFIIGPVAAGPALAILGMGKLFIVLTAVFGASSLLCWLLPSDGNTIKPSNGSSLKVELFDAFRHIHASNLVWSGLLLLTMSQALVSTIITIAPGYARSILGIAVTDTSLLMLAPAAAGMIVGAFVMSRIAHLVASRILIVIGLLLAGLELIGLGLVGFWNIYIDSIYLAAGLLFLLGIANAMVIVPSQTAVQTHTPDELRGRIFGVLGTMTNGASFLPVLGAGIIADTLGVAPLLLLLGWSVFTIGIYARSKVIEIAGLA